MWLVFSVTSLGVLLTGLNASTLDVALPTVVRHFSASATAASWILLSYLLVSTVLILPFGRLADIIGRRRLYLLGLALLTFPASWRAPRLTCRASSSPGWCRRSVPRRSWRTSRAILTDAFPTRKLSLGARVERDGGGSGPGCRARHRRAAGRQRRLALGLLVQRPVRRDRPGVGGRHAARAAAPGYPGAIRPHRGGALAGRHRLPHHRDRAGRHARAGLPGRCSSRVFVFVVGAPILLLNSASRAVPADRPDALR